MPLHLKVLMQIPNQEPKEFAYEFGDDARITLGRDDGNDIQIPLSTVSRNHAELFREGDEWFIEDKKSTHGTKHNSKPLQGGAKKLLRTGDVIEIVHFSIEVEVEKSGREFTGGAGTAALAQKMVQEVLQSIGDDKLPYVRVMNGPDEGRTYEIKADAPQILIGRGVDCDFQINDANISRRHAIVRRDWADITVEDAGSKNGVLVNDKKIAKPTSLRDADEVLLGAVRLTFIDPAAKFMGKLDDIPQLATENTPDPQEEPIEDEPVEEPANEPVAAHSDDFTDNELSQYSVGGNPEDYGLGVDSDMGPPEGIGANPPASVVSQKDEDHPPILDEEGAGSSLADAALLIAGVLLLLGLIGVAIWLIQS